METTEIGYISKTHGLKGQVILRMKDGLFLDEEKANSLFIEINGSQVPYFIEELRLSNNGYILKIETINAVEISKTLVGKKVYAYNEFVEEEESEFDEWIGYRIIDNQFGEIGLLNSVDQTTQNVLFNVVNSSGIEVILPFNEDLISEVNDTEKIIYYHAPEGLLDMYLSK